MQNKGCHLINQENHEINRRATSEEKNSDKSLAVVSEASAQLDLFLSSPYWVGRVGRWEGGEKPH